VATCRVGGQSSIYLGIWKDRLSCVLFIVRYGWVNGWVVC
jgi:hypothetical protein